MQTSETVLYKGDIKIRFDEAKHLYYVSFKEGEGWGPERHVKFSVSGITKVLDKPALVPWAVKMGAEALQALLPDFLSKHLISEQTLDGVAYRADEVALKELIAEVKGAHRKKMSDAGSIGTLAHQWIEEYIKMVLAGNINADMKQDPVNEYVKSSVRAFLNWQRDEKITFIESERRVYSKKHDFAGTCDLIGIRGKKRIVVDFKTSSGIYDEMIFQTAGYQLALEEEGLPKFHERWIVRIDKKTGEVEAKCFTEHKKDKDAFLNCFGIAKRLAELKKDKKQYND